MAILPYVLFFRIVYILYDLINGLQYQSLSRQVRITPPPMLSCQITWQSPWSNNLSWQLPWNSKSGISWEKFLGTEKYQMAIIKKGQFAVNYLGTMDNICSELARTKV